MTARPFTNRLARETSPYLLQHARNPVDWHPWDARALALAQTEDKPIFLSIGYSACHWCHVMERESFEDAETAAYLNAHFVNIKVDREERPDLDAIYMDAVQLMTRQGGWPMSVFLMPDGTPFHGGTYFPPTPRQGLPSFRQVLEAVAEAFARRRDDLQAHGVKMVAHLDALSAPAPAPAGGLDREGLLTQARTQLAHVFDAHYGGFGRAPKFPQPMTLDFLLAQAHDAGDRQARQMAEVTLTRMLNGGIYDQLGGGFHRYSVDAYWLVPHFEKMLYDNAQLLVTYLHAWQLTGTPDYRRTVLETIDYVLREMTHPEGGFYSAQDADSEGEEGTFFLWSLEEIEAELGTEAAQVACLALGATARGNFEGRNILHRPLALEECSRRLRLQPERLQAVLQEARRTLLQVRERRPRPARDDKILVEWNGLLIYALAQCGTVLPHAPALAAARRAADFIWERLRAADGRLRRSYKDGQAKFNGYLEDYAAYGRALLALFEADTNPVWLQRSQAVAATMRAEFEDAEGGAFFQTGHSHEKLVLRRKDFMDNAVPSGNSLAAAFLIRLAHIAGHAPYRASADRVFRRVGELMGAQPTAFGCLLAALQDRDAPTQEVIIVGDPDAEATRALLHAARQSYHPRRFVAHLRPDHASELPLLAGKTTAGGVPAAYVCRNQTCHAPVTNAADMLALMQAAPAAPQP